MKLIRFSTALVITLIAWTFFAESAVAQQITVTVNGQQISCANNPCNLATDISLPAGTTFSFTSGTVTASDTNVNDIISVSGLTIQAGSANASGTLNFSAPFNAPPSVSQSTPVGFFHTAAGKIMKNLTTASKGSSAQLTGFVNTTPIANPFVKTVGCTVPTCGTFSINPQQEDIYLTLNDNRTMSVELDFQLVNSIDLLTLTSDQHVLTGSPGVGGSQHLRDVRERMRQKFGTTRSPGQNLDCNVHFDPEGNCPPPWLDQDK